jgi:hypothetical protein
MYLQKLNFSINLSLSSLRKRVIGLILLFNFFSTTLFAQEDSLNLYFDNNHENDKSSFLTIDLFQMIPIRLFPSDFSILYEKKIFNNLRAEIGLGLRKSNIFFPFYNKEQDPLRYSGILRLGLKIVKPYIKLNDVFGSYWGIALHLHNHEYKSSQLLHISSGFAKEILFHYGFHIRLTRIEIKPYFGFGLGFCKLKIANQDQFDSQIFSEKYKYFAEDTGLRISYRLGSSKK